MQTVINTPETLAGEAISTHGVRLAVAGKHWDI